MSSTEAGLRDSVFVLVTGANSGLGFSICCRLIDEFLLQATKPGEPQHLTIIFTTRSPSKGNDTLARLNDHLRHAITNTNTNSTSTSTPTSTARVDFHPENVDLSNLLSVRALSRRLHQTTPKLDAIVLNAGLGGWTGIDWPRAVWGVTTDLVQEVSWPSYKLSSVGMIAPRQVPESDSVSVESGEGEGEGEPRLGAIFCSNVFGHYLLGHYLAGLLKRAGGGGGDDGSDSPGRIIWVSSLEATTTLFDVNDIQGIRSQTPYESSKALTDILALTSNHPATAPWVKSYYSTTTTNHEDTTTTTTTTNNNNNNNNNNNQPPMYLSHPGICGTSILPLSTPLFYAMLCTFWLARFLGSPWHTLSTYLGASAPVWLALAPDSELGDAEAPYVGRGGGRVKWGSSCDWRGRGGARPVCTMVDGWGFGGVVGGFVYEGDRDRSRRGKRGARCPTREEKEGFVELGRECWRRMEELRVVWEGVLDRAEGVASY